MKKIIYQQMLETDFLLANHFLKQNKQPTAGKTDIIYAAVLDHKVVGAVWLTQKETSEALWMRSLFVVEEYRLRKIGTQLINTLIQCSNHPIICFAHPTLDSFYLKTDFIQTEFDSLPTWLKKKYAIYKQHQKLRIWCSNND